MIAARLIVYLAAWIAPPSMRARWREEWLAEIESARHGARPADVLRHAAGAPLDAALATTHALAAASGRLVYGWQSDWRQTRRALWHGPRHAATVILCLGAGITVTVSVLSVINSLFYGDIPGVHARTSLVRIFIGHDDALGTQGMGRPGTVIAEDLSLSDFRSLAVSPPSVLSGLAAEGEVPVAVSHGTATAGAIAAFVSPEYFQVLGTTPLHGRLLSRGDHDPGAPPAAVIGYHLWNDYLGAAADLTGQTVLIAGREFLVAGIAPPRFTGVKPADPTMSVMDSVQVWLPLRHAEQWPAAPAPERSWLTVFGRRKPSTSVEDVRVALVPAASRRAAEQPDARAGAVYHVRSHGFSPSSTPVDVLIVVAMILSIPLTVLAVACLNVANLQLARATTRARELALRLAIGASRGQVIRLLSIEAAALACGATIVGWAGAAAGLRLLQAYFPLILTLDWRVLLATLTLTTGVTMVAGVVPAWIATRRWSADHLRHTTQGGGLPHTRLRHSLVVLQIATSFVLLAGSNLFVRTAQATRADVPASIREQLIVSFDVGMVGEGPADAARITRELAARLTSRPDVTAVSFERNTAAHLGRSASDDPAAWRYMDIREVTPSFAAVTDVRLLAGRWLTASDASEAVVVNARLARLLDPDDREGGDVGAAPSGRAAGDPPAAGGSGGSVVGRTVALRSPSICATAPCAPSAPTTVTIVGVVENQRRRVDDALPDALIYRRLTSMPAAFDLRIRTTNPAGVGTDLRSIVRGIDPRLPWSEFWRGPDLFAGEFDGLRVVALSVGGLGVLALLLAAAGLYAVVAYVVSLRQREFGIRIAIGARPADLRALVSRVALRLSAWGLGLGLIVAIPLAFAFRALIVGVSMQLLDPFVWAPVMMMLATAAFVAAVVPARRAARVDPISVLRAE